MNAKRLISLFISIIMLLSMAVPSFAEEPEAGGEPLPSEQQEPSVPSEEQLEPTDEDLVEEPDDSTSEPSSQEPAENETPEAPSEELQTEVAEPEAEILDESFTVYLNYADELNRVGFANLSVAVEDSRVVSGSVLTLVSDQELTSRLYITKNLTITDDGTPRTIYLANNNTGSSDGRGIQVNAGVTVSISGSSFGSLTVCGRSKNPVEGTPDYESNSQQAMYVYNGTLCLENLLVTECDPVSSSAVGAAVYVNTEKGGKLSVSNCSFTGNTASSGADIYIAAGAEADTGEAFLTLSGAVYATDVSYNLTDPISLSAPMSDSAHVVLTVPADLLNEGAQLLVGDTASLASAPKCIIPSGIPAGLKLDSQGYISEIKVASIGGTLYSTLADAVKAATNGQTITLIDDASVDARISISSKSLTITDDGNPHTIYIYNTERTGTYGRGIQQNTYNKTLNITATQKGNLTIVGHSPDGSTYNYSAVIVAYGSTVNLNNVIIRECAPTTYGAIYTVANYPNSTCYIGTVNLNNCTVEDNTAVNSNGGAAVYNRGCVNINSGTIIRNNYSTSAVTGAVFNDAVYQMNSTNVADAPTVNVVPVSTISAGTTVTGNLKNCSNHEDFGVAADGKASNIYASLPGSIVVNGNPAVAGIDYEGNSDAQFGTVAAGYSGQCSGLVCDTDATLTPYISNSNLYWGSFFSLNPGSAADISGLSYSLSNAAVTITGGFGVALTVSADCGSFLVPWASFTPSNPNFNFTKLACVAKDGEYTELNALPDTSEEYMGICIYASWTQDDAQSFIRSLRFTTPGGGMTQKVTMDVFKEIPEGSLCFGGSTYSYLSGPCSASRADTIARGQQAHLAVITDKSENAFLKGAFGSQGWLGGVLASDSWYWAGGKNDGLRISASAGTNRGYQGAFVSWAEGEPADGNTICFNNGLWYAQNSETKTGFYIEMEDANASLVSTVLGTAAAKPALNSMSINLNSGFSANYFFSFPQEYIDSDTAMIDVQVGSSPVQSYLVKDIAVAENLWEKDGSYKLTVPFNACQMNADVVITVYNGEGNPVRVYGGSGSSSNYNLRWYAETVILKQHTGDKYNSGFSEDLVNYVIAMLNYGAAAQQQFLTEPGELANADYEYTGALITASELDSAAVLSHTNTSVGYTVSVIAGSSTVIRIYPNVSGFSATVDSLAASTGSDTNGSYVEIVISPDKLSRIYTVSFTGSFSDTVSINALGAIQGLLNSSSDEKAKTTADRLYRLNLAANKYFGVYTPAASAVEAVVNTAYAYLAKTQYIQYDQHKLTTLQFTGHSTNRRQLNMSPEQISSQNTVYMDCSSFVWNVYRDVFGAEQVEAALGLSVGNMSTVNMKNVSTAARAAAYTDLGPDTITAMLSELQPGDMIVKYSSTKGAGHVVLWTGNGYIHCTGASYSFNDTNPDKGTDKTEPEGAIHYVSADNFKASWYNGYNTVVILRPLNVLGNADLLPAGTLHQQTGGIAVSKTAVSGGVELFAGQSVTPGATITYTIRIENPIRPGALTAAQTVNISDSIPAGTSFSSFTGACSGSVSGSDISWTDITLAAGDTVELKYNVTVTATAGASIVPTQACAVCSAAGSLSGTVSFTNNEITVESEATSTINSLVTLVKARKSQTSSGISDINTILTNKGLDTLGTEDTDWIDAIFGHPSSGDYYYVYPSTESSLPSKLVSNFASGRKVLNYSLGGGSFDTDTRVRNITVSNLRKGDIIAVYNANSSEYRYYVYIGLSNGTESFIKFVSGQDVEEVPAGTLLPTLLNMTCFAVFRFAGR